MENTPHLYDTLVRVLSQQPTWLDRRHLQTLAWMMVGLIHSGWINLTAWAPYVVSRAQYAQSTVRRFRRWLDNDKIDVLALYSPLIQHALAEWGEQALYVALDTSMLWDTYCLIRLSVIYRGRAVPLVWCVLKHGSAQVSFEAYKELLEQGGYDVTTLAARLGKPESHVYQRLKLNDLIKEGQKLFLENQIGFGHAVILDFMPKPNPARPRRAAALIHRV